MIPWRSLDPYQANLRSYTSKSVRTSGRYTMNCWFQPSNIYIYIYIHEKSMLTVYSEVRGLRLEQPHSPSFAITTQSKRPCNLFLFFDSEITAFHLLCLILSSKNGMLYSHVLGITLIFQVGFIFHFDSCSRFLSGTIPI